MKEPDSGDFVVCIDDHKGIVTAVRDSPFGRMIFVIEVDGEYNTSHSICWLKKI